MMTKLNELSSKLLFQPPYRPDMSPSDYCLFADLKKIFHEKRFDSNEEVIAEIEDYFGNKDKSFN